MAGKIDKWLEPENLILLEGWARDGLSMEQIAANCGCGKTSFYEWMKKSPDIANAIKKGREVSDYMVENAMFKSALGYYVEEHEEKLTESGEVVDTTKRRWIPPSNTAQIFWLKNRRPDKWRDKPIDDSSQADLLASVASVLGGVNSAIK